MLFFKWSNINFLPDEFSRSERFSTAFTNSLKCYKQSKSSMVDSTVFLNNALVSHEYKSKCYVCKQNTSHKVPRVIVDKLNIVEGECILIQEEQIYVECNNLSKGRRIIKDDSKKTLISPKHKHTIVKNGKVYLEYRYNKLPIVPDCNSNSQFVDSCKSSTKPKCGKKLLISSHLNFKKYVNVHDCKGTELGKYCVKSVFNTGHIRYGRDNTATRITIRKTPRLSSNTRFKGSCDCTRGTCVLNTTVKTDGLLYNKKTRATNNCKVELEKIDEKIAFMTQLGLKPTFAKVTFPVIEDIHKKNKNVIKNCSVVLHRL